MTLEHGGEEGYVRCVVHDAGASSAGMLRDDGHDPRQPIRQLRGLLGAAGAQCVRIA